MSEVTLKPCPPDDLRPWGWAPGDYSIYCMDCGHTVSRMMAQGAKRSTRCKDHAVEAWRNTRVVAHPPAAPDTVTLDRALVELTLPILGVENRTAQEVFDIMCGRIRILTEALK